MLICNHSFKASSDTAISISFGIISVSISLIGVWISYLTLRAMPRHTGTPPISLFPTEVLSNLSLQLITNKNPKEIIEIIPFGLLSITNKSFDTNIRTLFLPSRRLENEPLRWREAVSQLRACSRKLWSWGMVGIW
jgi:hypothetical protein